jgi:hypothetical protein
MGTITRSLANNITTGGVILPAGITNSSVSAVTSFANAPAGTLTLLSTQTASNSATISFTSGLDSTYDAYEFKFINIIPSTEATFQFQGSTNGGSTYATTITSTSFRSIHDEADTVTSLAYRTSNDLAQSTSFQNINEAIGTDSDSNFVGNLELYNPSSTTYVKHFISRSQTMLINTYSSEQYTAGYFNTTSAINAIQFKMNTGNFSGIIKLYGVKKS